MKAIPTLLRRAEHAALSRVTLSGSVLDLGGEKGADYIQCFQGHFSLTTVNLAEQHPDIVHDLEKPLPLPDASYDNALLINVLEHIYEYRTLLAEAARVTRPGGVVVVIVPFLFPVHPSPHDYWRLSGEALRRELEALGLSTIRIEPLGTGVLAARYVMLDRLLPAPLRLIGYYSWRYLVGLSDRLFARVARATGRKYLPGDYALGYLATGIR